jgi:hypothetical protein
LEQQAPLIREEQEKELPGEKERIMYGLSVLSAEDIKKLILDAITTTEGLRACATIFTPKLLPSKQIITCTRCRKEWDPQYSGRCHISHIDSHTQWNGSKESYEECERCRRKHGYCYKGSYNEEDSWCFDGTHSSDT